MKKLLLSVGMLYSFHAFSQTQAFTTAGTHTFTPHASVIEATFEAIGGGGGGGRVTNGSAFDHKAAGGGGGGAYIKSFITVSGGTAYSVHIGAGGYNYKNEVESNAGDTYFNSGSEARAKGGLTKLGNGANNSPGAAGGHANSCVIRHKTGTSNTAIAFSGGNGDSGTDSRPAGGGGGGAAGSTGDGTNGSRPGAGSGNSGAFINGNIYSGNGGNGGDKGAHGNSGNNHGGGGGGGSKQSGTKRDGGTGGVGVAVIYWSEIHSLSASSGCPGDIITIYGSNFVNVTNVTFNGVAATINSTTTTTINVTVPNASSGDIVITTTYGRSKAGFTYNATPASPTAITGNTLICAAGNEIYSIGAVTNATSYTWTLPSGWSGSSTGTAISATTNGQGGVISVIANGTCGNSTATTLTINAGTAPAQPSTITGNTSICNGIGNTYSVTNDPNATSYTWSFPSGWSGSSNINSVTATPSTNSGNISVTANNACGSSAASTLAINVAGNVPAQPVYSTGNLTICNGSNDNYSVQLDNSASSYVWTLSGDLTGSSSTNSIAITTGPNGGTAQVTAANACGSSQPLSFTIVSDDVPSVASATITGNTSICANTSETYTISNITNVTSYSWSLPNGWTGTSTINSIQTTTSTNGGVIEVTATNNCGTSAPVQLNINLQSIPAQPSAIAGSTNICNGTGNAFSVTNDANATSYTWTMPAGWTGSSTTNNINVTPDLDGTISVVANNACGSSTASSMVVTVAQGVPSLPALSQGDINLCANTSDIFEVNLDPTATYTWTLTGDLTGNSNSNSINITTGANGGTAQVMATNACGNSALETITINPTNIPDVSNALINGNTNICGGSNQTFTVNNTLNANYFTWNLPTGWTGTSATNAINTVAGNSAGTISVVAVNTCGNSASVSLSITIENAPNQPSAITGQTLICTTSPLNYSVANDIDATSYTWTLPNGWTGTSNTNIITANPGLSGTISVVANGTCGASTPSTLVVSSPSIASTVLYPVSCLNYSLNGQTYTESGVYNQTLTTQSGCDSNITINLTILNQVNAQITSVGGLLSAVENNAHYQWISCDNNSIIQFANGQDFYPTTNGHYAVIVTKDGCSDTSTCYNMTKVSTKEVGYEFTSSLFPNPATDYTYLTIQNNNNTEKVHINIVDITGKTINNEQAHLVVGENQIQINTTSFASGIYFIQVSSQSQPLFIHKLIINK